MSVPQAYGVINEGGLVNYDYYDISEGTGIVVFYGHVGMTINSSPAIVYTGFLSKDIIPTYTLEISTGSVSTFTLPAFNTPKIMQGTARLAIMVKSASLINVTANIKKNSTTIATGSSYIGGGDEYVLNIDLVVPKTKYEIGDVLSLELTTSSSTVTIGVDPQNRDSTNFTPSTDPKQTTQLKLYIPFKIDL